MARATVAQVKGIVEEIQQELEKLTTIVKGDPEKNVVGLVTEIKLLKQRNQFEDRLANVAVGIGSALLVFLLTNGCSQLVSATATAEFPTVSPVPADTQMPEPSSTPTETATTAHGPTSTETQQPTGTPTPSIYEATPLGGQQQEPVADYWQGLPSGTQYELWFVTNIRTCPDRSCTSLDRYGIGKTIEIYAKYHIFGSEDEWFCLEELDTVDKETHCRLAVAYKYQGQQLGEIIWP